MVREVSNNKTAKCVKKNVIKRDLDHSHYLACLQNNTIEKHKMKTIRSDYHVISSYEINKTSLSCFDDKNRLLHRKCAVRNFIHESQNFRNERVSVANE